jgi:hypothetical protein
MVSAPNQAGAKKKLVISVRGKTGFGGSWRAYIRRKSVGTKGKPNLKDLGESYGVEKAARSAQHAKDCEVGRAATRFGRGQIPSALESTFGPNSRTSKLEDAKRLRDSVLAETRGLDKDAQAIVVSRRAVEDRVDIGTCLALARSSVHAASLAARERKEKRTTLLRDWQAGRGAEHVKEALELAPALSYVPWHAVPTPKGAFLHCAELPVEDMAAAVEWVFKSKKTNISSVVKKHWSELHHTLTMDQCPPCEEEVPKESLCMQAGVCLCSTAGRRLAALRNRFFKAMKEIFVRHSAARTELANGNVVVKISNALPSDAAGPSDQEIHATFYHIGLMYWSPYRPTFLQVVPVASPDAGYEDPNVLFIKVCALCGTQEENVS